MIIISDYLLFDLKQNFPQGNAIPFPIKGNPQSFILVMPPQGNESRYYTNGIFNASLVIQNTDARKALEVATSIYDYYRDKVNYTMSLPNTHEPQETKRNLLLQYIQPVDRPVPLGDVGNGRYQYSLNFNMMIGGYSE
jgi:hypothetical protein